MSADMRAAFEHWMSDGGESPNAVRRAKPDGEYALMQAAYAWTAWQAAWTTQRAEIERLTRECESLRKDAGRYRLLESRNPKGAFDWMDGVIATSNPSGKEGERK